MDDFAKHAETVRPRLHLPMTTPLYNVATVLLTQLSGGLLVVQFRILTIMGDLQIT